MANLGLFGGGLTLKALLENPDLQSAPIPNKSEKEKKENDLSFDTPSAFLGPNLWDKTYDNTDINLEYMDLDEFLSENGIPVNLDALDNVGLQSPSHSNSSDSMKSVGVVDSLSISPPPVVMPVPSPPRVSPPVSPKQLSVTSSVPSPPALSSTQTVSPPESPKSVDFSVSNEDLALVNISGEENFDPRKRAFSEEELKPQPMIKKSKKIFINDDAKDEKYWARRKKNNVAAKRSRDARRIKENQIAMRASFLEKENSVLRTEMEKIKKENTRLKTALAKYEPTSS